MFSQTSLNFLKGLKENNNKDWFEAHRKEYNAARADQKQFIEKLLERMGRWDERMKKLSAKDCIFRINRDIRFSADKSPYKSNMSFYFAPGGKNSSGSGYYFHFEPGNSFLGGGVWAPQPPALKAIRQEIDYNLEEFESILNAKAFKKYYKTLGGESLKKAPKEYSADHPGIEWLKHKDFTAMSPVKDADLTSAGLADHCNEAFKALQPLNNFLDRGLGLES
jgi:uncharacterized protein (TIGR02453 family)